MTESRRTGQRNGKEKSQQTTKVPNEEQQEQQGHNRAKEVADKIFDKLFGDKDDEEFKRKKRILNVKFRDRQRGRIVLLRKCPLCQLKISDNEEMELLGEKNEEGKPEFFYLIQFGANVDNSGYESYRCERCELNMGFLISKEQIVVKPNFVIKGKKKIMMAPPGGGGNGPFGGNPFGGGYGGGAGPHYSNYQGDGQGEPPF